MSSRTISVEHPQGPLPLARPAGQRAGVPVERGPVMALMVDFADAAAHATTPEQRVDDALKQMRSIGVRSLLVVVEAHVVGLITAEDIQGEKPVQFVRSSDCIHPRCHHDDVEVGDIMTATAALPVLHVDALERASLDDLMETFRQYGRTHLLCVDGTSDGALRVRGLISRSQIERQLGLEAGARVLEEVEREIAGSLRSGRVLT